MSIGCRRVRSCVSVLWRILRVQLRKLSKGREKPSKRSKILCESRGNRCNWRKALCVKMRIVAVLVAIVAAAVTEATSDSPETNRQAAEALLSTKPECASDLTAASNVCPPHLLVNNFAVLAYLTEPDQTTGAVLQLKPECETLLWDFKVKLIQDDRVLSHVHEQCTDSDWSHLSNCSATGKGHVIACIIERKNELAVGGVSDERDAGHTPVLSNVCSGTITQVESVVFSDYQLTGSMIEQCQQDVLKLACGKVATHKHLPHSQGLVVACLEDQLDVLSQACRKELLKMAEFQGEDFHLDRGLFLACQRDRHHLCPQVKPGEGRIYECLLTNKMNPELTEECRSALTRRQHLVAEDYRVSRGLARACKKAIARHHCRTGLKGSDHDDNVRLAHVLLCLEDAARNSVEAVGSECATQMKEHRKMLMEDFRISPEIVADCKEDIQASCGKMSVGGQTLHCLMGLATSRRLQEKRCEDSLMELLQQVDVSQDWNVDPVLQQNCRSVVDAACDIRAGPDAVMSCLMLHASRESKYMTKECKKTLVEIYYFISRDFTLDNKLFRKCHKDAEKLCNADADWHAKSPQAGVKSQLIFPCLVRHLYNNDDDDDDDDKESRGKSEGSALSDSCADQVERVLEERAFSVQMHPDIEEACRDFLMDNCMDRTGPGEEMLCLQERLGSLEPKCYEAVKSYTKVEARNVGLNVALATACQRVIKEKCSETTQHSDDGRTLTCLIESKLAYDSRRPEDTSSLDDKCATAIEHWQILTMEDWSFSAQFKQSCTKDVRKFCEKRTQSKLDVLMCLTENVQSDLMEDRPPRVSERCRAQLKFELLQKHADIKLDKKLESGCGGDLDALCGHDRSLECLRNQKHTDLSPGCLTVLFGEQREEAIDDTIDHFLTKSCMAEIKQHCDAQAGSANGILECLKTHIDDAGFDLKCRRVVVRRIIQQMKDFRLNPRLQKACRNDMSKFCADLFVPANGESPHFLEGKVIDCLKREYVKEDNKLTEACKGELGNVLRSASVDIRANPVLMSSCPNAVAYCQKETNFNESAEGDSGKVEECLKTLFKDKQLSRVPGGDDGEKCAKELATVIEAEATDVEMDPVLRRVCEVDLSKFCATASPGRGKMECLRAAHEDDGLRLEPKCEGVMKARMAQYRAAVELPAAAGVADLYEQVSRSPHRNYFGLLFLSAVGLIFVFGLMCGRVSQRLARRELKNK